MFKYSVILAIMVLNLGYTTILAKVGNVDITEDDLTARLNSLPPQYAGYYSTPEGKKKLLDQMIDEKLLYLEAKEKGYEKDPEVIKTTQKLQEEVMTNFYLRKVLADLTVSEKEIKDYYEQNKSKFSTPEAVRASHILVKTEAEAREILKELKAGKNFAELAKEKSSCPSGQRGGDLDFFSKGQMVEPFEKAAFALKEGEITKEPVKTQFGYHIIKLTERKAAEQKKLEEVKTEIRNELLQEKQRAKLEQIVSNAKIKYPVIKN